MRGDRKSRRINTKTKTPKCWLLQFLSSPSSPSSSSSSSSFNVFSLLARTQRKSTENWKWKRTKESKAKTRTKWAKKNESSQKNGNRSHFDLIFVSFWLRFISRIIWLHYTQWSGPAKRRMFACLSIVIYSIYHQHYSHIPVHNRHTVVDTLPRKTDEIFTEVTLRKVHEWEKKKQKKNKQRSIYTSIIVMGMLFCMLCVPGVFTTSNKENVIARLCRTTVSRRLLHFCGITMDSEWMSNYLQYTSFSAVYSGTSCMHHFIFSTSSPSSSVYMDVHFDYNNIGVVVGTQFGNRHRNFIRFTSKNEHKHWRNLICFNSFYW